MSLDLSHLSIVVSSVELVAATETWWGKFVWS